MGFVYRQQSQEAVDTIADEAERAELMRSENFGFAKVEHYNVDICTLFIQRDGGPKFKLIPLTETEFNYEDTAAQVVFNANLKEIEITNGEGNKVKAVNN